MFRGADKSVFQHFGITGEEVVCIEAAQELRFEEHRGGRGEDADFILQSVEVDARLPPTEASTIASSVVGTLI